MRGVAQGRRAAAALVLGWLLSIPSPAAAQAIASISAFTQPGGASIAAGVWQPDTTPYLTWVPEAGGPPIGGYSWAVDAAPDCTSETVAANVQLGPQSDGSHSFQVRAIDEASNCGQIASFTLNVDSSPDEIAELLAFAQPGGAAIQPGVVQSDTDPYMTWSPSTGTAPIDGYSWGVEAGADCVADGKVEDLQLPALGDGLHAFTVRAIDEAGNCGAVATFQLAVDATGDPVASLSAFTASGGAAIAPGVPQSDVDPFMEWTVTTGLAPLAGSSWMVDGAPDCSPDTGATSVQLAPLSDGLHEFRVRAVDEAGNCGAVATFQLAVDATGDPIASLSAFTASGGTAISPGVPQSDVDPFMEWTVTTGLSPLTGSSWMVDGAPDCSADTGATSVQLAPLSDGLHEFRVRTIDQAGNCGGIATFQLAIQSVAPQVPALRVRERAVLAAVLLLTLVSMSIARSAKPRS